MNPTSLRVPSRAPFVVLAVACAVACAPREPDPTPTDLARAAVAGLDAANVRLTNTLVGVSAITDTVYTDTTRVQATATFLADAFPADAVDASALRVLTDAVQIEAESLDQVLGQFTDTNDEFRKKRDLLEEMVSWNDQLRDALRDVADDTADSDAPSSAEPATTSTSWGVLLGQSVGAPVEARDEVIATFACPGFGFVNSQIDLIDLATGDVLATKAGATPLEVRATRDDWSLLRATGRLIGGDLPDTTLVPCTVQVDHARRQGLDAVDWTDARVDDLQATAPPAVRAVRDAREELTRRLEATDATAITQDEYAAFSAVVSLYEARLGRLTDAADAKALTVVDLDWLDGQMALADGLTLRLQALLERRDKFINTLSNVMKKVSTTQDVLTQNMK